MTSPLYPPQNGDPVIVRRSYCINDKNKSQTSVSMVLKVFIYSTSHGMICLRNDCMMICYLQVVSSSCRGLCIPQAVIRLVWFFNDCTKIYDWNKFHGYVLDDIRYAHVYGYEYENSVWKKNRIYDVCTTRCHGRNARDKSISKFILFPLVTCDMSGSSTSRSTIYHTLVLTHWPLGNMDVTLRI